MEGMEDMNSSRDPIQKVIANYLWRNGFTYRIHGYEVIAVSRNGGVYVSIFNNWKTVYIEVFKWGKAYLDSITGKIGEIAKRHGYKVKSVNH